MVAPGGCPTCGGDLKVAYSQVGSRYVRCVNYEECKTAYPLPQQGEIEATEERCECGAPKVIVHTRKGPWKICVDPSCPLKPERSRGTRGGKSSPASGKRSSGGRKSTTGKKSSTGAKKATGAKRAAREKPSDA
jgi:DNA topoisomerase-1